MKKYSYNEMENAVMIAADLFQRFYAAKESPDCQEVVDEIVDEAVEMEKWLVEKYGEDDVEYLDCVEEYEKIIVERHELPEPEKPESWQFDEQAFLGQYCPMEGGNDYLGWIDDIYKLLDGEAEPGDAASMGDYAKCSEDELRKELKRLTRIVLHQAVDEYVERNY